MDDQHKPVDTKGSGTEHKTRRPHKKSRYGCTKCKARRIKVIYPPTYKVHFSNFSVMAALSVMSLRRAAQDALG